MDRLSTLTPELLREIVSYLPTWTQRVDCEAENVKYLSPVLQIRDTSGLKSLALVSKKCRDASNAIMYGGLQVVTYTNAYAQNLIDSPHLHTHIRNLAWVKDEFWKVECDESEAFVTAQESDFLLRLLQKANRVTNLTVFHTEEWTEFRIIVPPGLSLLHLRTIWTSPNVQPQALLPCCPSLQTINCGWQFTENNAMGIVSGLRHTTVTSLTMNIEAISLRFLRQLAKVTSLQSLTVNSPMPHQDPWSGVEGYTPEDLGNHLAAILRPLQELKKLSLSIVIDDLGLSEPDPDAQRRNDYDETHRDISFPLAQTLPNLEQISWLIIVRELVDFSGLDPAYSRTEKFFDKSLFVPGNILRRQDGDITIDVEH